MSSLFSKYSANKALKIQNCIHGGELLLLLKEPRPYSSSLFFTSLHPTPREVLFWSVGANRGTGLKSSSAAGPACQRSSQDAEQLQPCLCVFSLLPQGDGSGQPCFSGSRWTWLLLLCLHMFCSRELKWALSILKTSTKMVKTCVFLV